MCPVKLKYLFGAFDVISAGLLWRKRTHKLGLGLAVIGFPGVLYGQLYNGDGVAQVATFLGLSIAELVLSLISARST